VFSNQQKIENSGIKKPRPNIIERGIIIGIK